MEHYFSEKQASEFKPFKISVKYKLDSFSLYSASGIFSKDSLDNGSKLLIEKAVIKENDEILDIGCGNGVVGICILRIYKNIDMVFSDINERALKITKKNLKFLNLKGKVIKSDIFNNINDKFDVILSNPPYAAGREVCFNLISNAYTHLKNDGTLQLVAKHNKGGKVLKQKMAEVFGNAEDLAKNSGFRVYISKKK